MHTQGPQREPACIAGGPQLAPGSGLLAETPAALQVTGSP
jgi:hypothetical protein